MKGNITPDDGSLGISQISKNGISAFVRDGTSDQFVFDEVVRMRSYKKLGIRPTDTVLDLGMNIGIFTVTALKCGAEVHGFEPTPSNFKMARRNVQLNGFTSGFHLNQKAVTGTDEPTRSFSVNLRKNKGAHSLVAKRGRSSITVTCENINSILARVRPSIIKMDIEGGEYECIMAAKSFAGVREFQFEFHHAHLVDTATRAKRDEVLRVLHTHFNHVEAKLDTKGAWVSLFYCANK